VTLDSQMIRKSNQSINFQI